MEQNKPPVVKDLYKGVIKIKENNKVVYKRQLAINAKKNKKNNLHYIK
ncbi:hypothetical protein [Clostridium sp. DL1XJH146]